MFSIIGEHKRGGLLDVVRYDAGSVVSAHFDPGMHSHSCTMCSCSLATQGLFAISFGFNIAWLANA